ncbi:Mitochondrial inner membrane protease subunit 2 [Gracilariopsis chorda]|uniref:Mitochondrial inner membrane protease subunit 2 n=1 Tax=Gracilariopsis chorda TaxID=448386 RepID=A0A2V3IQF8_9FLOR|nr:Mitochondrial inner membrane protease subunit 2 [Gracilariopsis chorda]|eukprot:PXF43380.1 Mitochondrial inner membrane protease subunit 2 [Gracilariopsis chorda]
MTASKISRLVSLLSYVPLAIVFHDKIGTIYVERTSDMEPAVPRNTPCIIARGAKISNFRRGEILAVMAPDGHLTLRRLVALPGDHVRDDPHYSIVPNGFLWLQPDHPEHACPLPRGKTPVALVVGRLHSAFRGNTALVQSKNTFTPAMPYE